MQFLGGYACMSVVCMQACVYYIHTSISNRLSWLHTSLHVETVPIRLAGRPHGALILEHTAPPPWCQR